MRCILVILDGLGDRGQAVLAGQTPLQAAHTAHLDRLATMGMNGHYHPYLQGVPMSSEIAHFLIFGYDLEEFPGRGYLEAVGHGVQLHEGDVVLLCHFSNVREETQGLVLVKEKLQLTESEVHVLSEAVASRPANDMSIRFVPAGRANGFLVLSGRVSPAITDSNPIVEGRPLISVQPTDDGREAQNTATALNHYLRWVYQSLSQHPANIERERRGLPPANALVTQRAGRKRLLTPFLERWGLHGLSISSSPIYWGLSRELGMEVLEAEDSSDHESDFRERLRLAHKASEYDFVHVHTKMPDEAGHTKNPLYKLEVIEAIDRGMDFALQEIAPDADSLLVVTADHSTASSGTMIHSGETVPLTMLGAGTRRDNVAAFSEIDCAQGALGLVKGKELMYLVLNFLDKAKMKGLRDTPVDQPYYPGHYRPLALDGE